MALTIDDKQKILALRARGFSYDRIAKELEYSPTTVRKVVLEPQGGSRGEAPLLPGTGPLTSASPALPQEYAQLLAQQALGVTKEDLRSRAEVFLAGLEEVAEDVAQERLADEEWEALRKRLEGSLQWAVEKLEAISTPEEATQLEGIQERIEGEGYSLVAPYVERVGLARRQRHDEIVDRSRKLLARSLRLTGAPRSVVQGVQQCLLVKDETEAETVTRAVLEYAHLLPRTVEEATRRRLWKHFLDRLRAERWGYVRGLARQFQLRDRDLQRRSFGELIWCRACVLPLRVASGSIGWFSCPRCGASTWKGGPGPPALPPTP